MAENKNIPPVFPRPSRFWSTIKSLARARTAAGLITVLPIYITILVVQFVFRLLRDSSQWVVYGVLQYDWSRWGLQWKPFTDQELDNPGLQWGLAIFSVFLTAFILYAIGVFATNILGKRLLHVFEHLIDRLPLVKSVYHACKQILESFAGPTVQTFQRVVLLPFPSKEVRSIGFVTSTTTDTASGHELCTVFLPTTPVPTAGYVFVMPRTELIELDWTVEEAVRVVMSGGILTPGRISLGPATK